MKWFFAALLILIAGCKPAAYPTTDLASQSQETRDAAAKILRATVKPPSKIRWFFFTRHIKTGESQSRIKALLRSYKLNPDWDGWWVEGLAQHYTYRLDDYWCLNCEFTNKNESLVRWKLSPEWRAVWIQPSTNFSGTWVNYYVNGQKYSEGYYTNGIRSGEFTRFQSNGSKMVVQHYNLGKLTGLSTSYYLSGRIMVTGLLSNGAHVGIWTTYNQDGSTNLVRDFSKKETN